MLSLTRTQVVSPLCLVFVWIFDCSWLLGLENCIDWVVLFLTSGLIPRDLLVLSDFHLEILYFPLLCCGLLASSFILKCSLNSCRTLRFYWLLLLVDTLCHPQWIQSPLYTVMLLLILQISGEFLWKDFICRTSQTHNSIHVYFH